MRVAELTAPSLDTRRADNYRTRDMGCASDRWIDRLWARENERGDISDRQLTDEIARSVCILIHKSGGWLIPVGERLSIRRQREPQGLCRQPAHKECRREGSYQDGSF